MKKHCLSIVLCIAWSVLLYSQENDYDGDGLVGTQDRYPLLSQMPPVSWEIKKMILTWDANTELIEEQWDKKNKTHLTRTTFSFGTANKVRIEGKSSLPITINIFKLFTDASLKIQAGICSSSYINWDKINQEEIKNCLEALQYQKRHVKNPHWKITVWFNNQMSKPIIARYLEVPILDAQENVIAYAKPYGYDKNQEFVIPPMRRVAVQFRAESDTLQAWEQISKVKEVMPIFGLSNSCGTLSVQGDGNGLDIISKIQIIHQKTTPVMFEYDGRQIAWRIAHNGKDGKAVTIREALAEIERWLQPISIGRLVTIDNGRIQSLAGYTKNDNWEWQVWSDGVLLESFSDQEIGQKLVFRYAEKETSDRILARITDRLLNNRYDEAMEEAELGLKKYDDPRIRVFKVCILYSHPRAYQMGNAWEAALQKQDVDRLHKMQDSVAMTLLSYLYHYGLLLEQDYSKAAEYAQKAADSGHVFAIYMLGHSYYYGKGVKKDFSQAVKYFQHASGLNHTKSIVSLAICYEHGHGVDQDQIRAVELYRKAADLGNNDSMYRLAICYEEGIGVKKDLTQAFAWYQQAALKDESYAMLRLGVMHDKGIGVKKDKDQALNWYLKAAACGNVYAMWLLGVDCEAKNENKANEWYKKALNIKRYWPTKGPRKLQLKFEYVDGYLQDDVVIYNNENEDWNKVIVYLQHISGSTGRLSTTARMFAVVPANSKATAGNLWVSGMSIKNHKLYIKIVTDEGVYEKSFIHRIPKAKDTKTQNWEEITWTEPTATENQ